MSSRHRTSREAGRLREGFGLLHEGDDSIEIQERDEELPVGMHYEKRRLVRRAGWQGVVGAYSLEHSKLEKPIEPDDYTWSDDLGAFGFAEQEIPAEPEILPPAHIGMGINGHHTYTPQPYAHAKKIQRQRHIKRINHPRNQFLH